MNYTFGRSLKFAIRDFFRNIWLSLATIAILLLALFSVNALASFNALAGNITASVRNQVDVSVFFNPGTSPAAIADLQEQLKAMPEVRDMVFISKEQALDSFKAKYRDNPKILEAIDEVNANPLVDAVVVRAKNLAGYDAILSFLSSPRNQPIIKYQNFTDHQKVIDRVNEISKKIKYFTVGFAGMFALIAILIIFNAIRIMIYTHREEINVMRLVGASNWLIRLPFLLESVICVVFAWLLSVGLMYAILGSVQPYIAAFTETYNFSLISYFNENFLLIFGGELLAVVVLNVISSGIAVSRYLKA
ncbi:MAG: permease-like cell division protein FtsX [Parcubacteria group bacterium]